MRRFAIVVLLLALVGATTGLLAQRQGGAGAAGRQGGAQPGAPGRQGGTPAAGRQGGRGQVRDQPAQTGTAAIRGRVVVAESGTPLRRAQVQATSPRQRPRAALTDAEGMFELRDLPAGTWSLRASKTGYVSQQLGQRSPFGPSEPVELSDGQQFTAQIALPRAGAITGRVFDEYGDPVANVRVGALRVYWTPTGRRWSAAGSTVMTDDTGAYRVYGLAPGRYYLSATAVLPSAADGLSTSDGPVTYSPVYYPGTTDLATAQAIQVGVAQEQSNINVGLTPARAVRISGTVLGSGGTPVQSAMVTLHAPGIEEIVGVGGRSVGTTRDGTFTLANVAPGNYTLEAVTRVRQGDSPPEVAALPITVGTQDIAGLTVTTTSGGSISGTIATDNGARVSLSGIRVTAPPMRAAQRNWQSRAQVADPGTFQLQGLMGPHALRFEQLPAGWAVKSVTANGVDISDTPLEFRGAEQVSVRVILTDRVAALTGTIRSDTPQGASVVVFPDEPVKWTVVSRYLRTMRVGDTGQFTIRGLPPHTRYLAVALEYLEAGEHLDPEFLQALRTVATPFSLTEGEQQSVDLPLLERQ
jgi:protocatechuate 3,4-dioxygenase beta subunit